MLLKPTVPGLCAMLQTIYETESCFSSDSTAGANMPSTGECVRGETADGKRGKKDTKQMGGAREGIKTEMLNALALLSFAFEVTHVCISFVRWMLGFVLAKLSV